MANHSDKQRNTEPKAERRRSAASLAAHFTADLAAGALSGFFKVLGTVLLIILVAGMMFTCVFAYYVKTCLTPNLNLNLEDFKLSESSTIWYTDANDGWFAQSDAEWQSKKASGKILETLSSSQNRIWVDYDDIPQDMMNALISIEDKRFYEHKGVDWYRTAGAFIQMFARMETSYGGSTITQQLIKNLTGEDEVTISRKLTEIFGALELEKKYDKQRILEWYMNVVYFGEGCWGVQTAAQTYFGKDVSELTLAEGACIVGITNLPTFYDPFYNEQNNKNRQETILHEMYEQGFIDYDRYKEAVAEELHFTRTQEEAQTQKIMSYYTETVIEDVTRDLMEVKGISRKTAQSLLYNGGYNIYCNMSPAVQRSVDTIYTNLSEIPATNYSDQQLQSSIVVMDPYDGRILGLSGGVGEKTINFGLNRATQTQRSAGSSFKPLASYGPGIDLGLITPATAVADDANIHLKGTNWFPRNDGGSNYGIMTIASALQYSLNTVAAQIVDILPQGPQTSYDYLTKHLGFTSLVSADIDYAPMALGQLTNGVTVREMAQAYCSFVNDGIFTYGTSYYKVTDSEGNTILDNSPVTIQAFEPNTAYCMTYMMQNGVEAGTGTEAALWTMPVAGKTGTSTDYMDRWFVGCTPYYVAAVWTGYDMPENINSGGNPAAQLWKKVMAPIHEELPYKAFTYPYLGEDTGIFGIKNVKTTDEFGGVSDFDFGGTVDYGDTGGANYDPFSGGFLSGGSDILIW